jgi:hypothetical protein
MKNIYKLSIVALLLAVTSISAMSQTCPVDRCNGFYPIIFDSMMPISQRVFSGSVCITAAPMNTVASGIDSVDITNVKDLGLSTCWFLDTLIMKTGLRVYANKVNIEHIVITTGGTITKDDEHLSIIGVSTADTGSVTVIVKDTQTVWIVYKYWKAGQQYVDKQGVSHKLFVKNCGATALALRPNEGIKPTFDYSTIYREINVYDFYTTQKLGTFQKSTYQNMTRSMKIKYPLLKLYVAVSGPIVQTLSN